jgi:hypothetical protein
MKLKANHRGENSIAEGEMPPVANSVPKKTPNDLLAEEISDALVSAGLVPGNRKDNLLSKLKIGGVKQDDWGLWVDLATVKQGAVGEAHNE